jgi:predicted NAD/FAD-binding protein
MKLESQEKIAIIGSGIAGMGCAYFLYPHHQVVLLEKNDYIGGHTNTAILQEGVSAIPIDTGFMVFNHQTYPNLLRFFQNLDITTQATDMSFSVNHLSDDLQWNGAGLWKLFSQRKNLFRPRFYKLLSEMSRFAKEATTDAANAAYTSTTIEEYANHKNYSNDFLNLFLIPMSGAIWSTSSQLMAHFPIQTLIRFFLNHGFLGLDTHFQWYTIQGGSQQYVKKLQAHYPILSKTNQRVTGVEQNGHQAIIYLENDAPMAVDRVILACHADEALSLLKKPTQLETDLLQHFQYEHNETHLHTDSSVMPSIKRTWAAWNYRIDEDVTTTHYWMNRLQNLPTNTQYFVSLNAGHLIQPEKICKTLNYTHPIFSVPAIQAQNKLPMLNQQSDHQRIFFCGSYFKYGFHEDAFTSALNLCRELLGSDPWP